MIGLTVVKKAKASETQTRAHEGQISNLNLKREEQE